VSPDDELDRLVERSRRIGADPALVLQGGGNTSTKLVEEDHAGRRRRVIRIKGSGVDLATCERSDFPGLWLDELEPLRARDAMSDDEIVAYVRRCLVEPDAVRPSIETLLHAFLPAPHVDHVHADAICSLANAPEPADAVRDALGADVAVVPYLRPGFELAKLVADRADARAVVLQHHGLVTWGDTHEESYALTRELVDRAAAYIGLAPVEVDAADDAFDGRGGLHDLWLVRLPDGCRASGDRCSQSTPHNARSPTAPTRTRSRRCEARRITCSASARARAAKAPSSSCRGSAAWPPAPITAPPGSGSSSRPTPMRRSRRPSTASAAPPGSRETRSTTSSTGRSSATG
jgi:hypothetical protein